MKPFKAEVHWIDHASTQGWCRPENDAGLVKMHSIGWVHREEKDFIVLSDTTDHYGKCRDPIAIARKLITKIKRLK